MNILDSMFRRTDTYNKFSNLINVGKGRIKDFDSVNLHTLSRTACSNLSMNSSTECNLSFGVS
ncbi:MAG: hypothetical protein J6W21_08030 [Bacteroidaceae bacterium]|nr:hypothetical protein [Bacteroidaceae bacterium]